MSLFPGNVDPEKLIGMKPEELKAKLDASVTKDDLKAVTDQVTQFNSGLAELKESLKALTTQPPPPEPIEDPTDPTTAVLTDPKGFIRAETKGIADAQLSTQAQLQEIRARQNPRLRGVFDKYGDELTASASKIPVQTRAQDGFWEWHARTFIGDKVVTGKLDQGFYPSLIGSSTIGVDPGDSRPDPNGGFDPQVAQWFKDRGVPLDKASRISRIMQRDGDPLMLSNYKEKGNA